MPAPDSPPISACELDDGSPHNHVSMFHRIAPRSPHITIHTNAGSATRICTVLAIVLATPWWNTNSAMKLNSAAHTTAVRGDSTRVETIVAIELAASWKPLMMSNTSATTIVATTMT